MSHRPIDLLNVLCNHVPVEIRHHGFKRTGGSERERVFVGEKLLKFSRKIVHVSFFKREPGMMDRLEIFRNVRDEHGKAIAHRFKNDERQTLGFRRMHIEFGVSKKLGELFSLLETEKADLRVSGRLALKITKVRVREARSSDDDKFGKRAAPELVIEQIIGRNQIVQTLVRNDAPDVQQ